MNDKSISYRFLCNNQCTEFEVLKYKRLFKPWETVDMKWMISSDNIKITEYRYIDIDNIYLLVDIN